MAVVVILSAMRKSHLMKRLRTWSLPTDIHLVLKLRRNSYDEIEKK